LIRHTLRSILWLSVVLLGILARPLHAQAPAGAVPVKTYTGFFNNTAVYFTAFETNSSNFAAANGLVYAPRLSWVNLSALPNMLFFQNAGAGQAVVLQTQPGWSNYSPLWYVLTAQWRGPGAMPLITSYSAALQWWQRGWLLIQRTGIIFNGPVIVINRPLGVLGGGNLAPTISPNEFMGISPAARTAYFAGHQGYYAGQSVTFLALEHARGVISHAPGAIPVPTIGLDFLGHAGIANFFEVPGQLPLIDSFPAGQVTVTPGTTYPQPSTGGYGMVGTATDPGGYSPAPTAYPQAGSDQSTLPPYSQPPYAGLYSPIWHVHQVRFQSGAQLLTSVQGLQAVLGGGLAIQIDGGVQDTFNCPIVSGLQSVNPNPYPNPNPNPNPGGNPSPATVSFSRDILRIFTNNGAQTCAQAGCHSGPSPTGGQNLEAANAYANIVNVTSSERPDLRRIMPGSVDQSYLFKKITGAFDIAGSQMPLAGGPLSAADIDLVRQWIQAGAPNN
jgi:hypothetical protein